jgi:hypothetical protein
MSARADLCGGRSAMIVPTATLLNSEAHLPPAPGTRLLKYSQ